MDIIAFTAEFWQNIGLSPTEVILAIGIVAVWGWAKITNENNKAVRENWHAETRKEVDEAKTMINNQTHEIDELRKHIDVCERDRVKLSIEQVSLSRELDTLKLLVATYRSCTTPDCPMKRIDR